MSRKFVFGFAVLVLLVSATGWSGARFADGNPVPQCGPSGCPNGPIGIP